ncbi:hypothetical protein V8E36_000726 [Tilletia maclaganii]
MNDPNTYNTYAEAFTQFPIGDIAEFVDPNGKRDGYAEITSWAGLADGRFVNARLIGWWKYDRPPPQTFISGAFMVGVKDDALQLVYDRRNLGVRHGNPTLPDYMERHIARTPLL